MKNLLPVLLILLVISCSQKSDSNPEISRTDSIISNNRASTNAETSFNINSVSISKAEIGIFPYLSTPEGYKYSDEHSKKYEEKYFFYNDSLIMTVSGKYYHARVVPDLKEEFSEAFVVKNYEQAIKKLGGVEVYSGRITNKASDLLRKSNMTYVKDMYDPYPYSYKQFVIRTPSGTIWIELCHGLNINAIDFTVIYEGEIEETIKIIKADELKNTLDKEGKVVLYINFETDKSTLMSEGIQAVEEIGLLMKNNPELKLSIEGYTDNTGTAEHNKKLSSDRAQSVVKKLEELNIAGSRLKAVGYGSDKPLVANDTNENRAKNRRVEIVKIR